VIYAFRSLRRSPGFTFAAVLTLAIGVGATTAIYSVVDRVLLQPLPFPAADRLVGIREAQSNTAPPFGYQEYLEWRARTRTLSGLAASTFDPMSLIRTREGTVRLSAGLVSTNFFEVLGSTAMLGRTIVSSDENNKEVAVLSYETWQRYFHGDRSVIGSTIESRSANRLLTVVGIMPANSEQLGTPLDYYTTIPSASRVGLASLIGRIRDGATLRDVNDEADAIGAAVRPPRAAASPALTGSRFTAEPLRDNLVSAMRPALRVFLTAVAVVLLIVCANLANLLLARGTSRRREIGVRLAIGASRARIIRQLMTECLVLAVIGGSLGAVIAGGGVALVKNLAQVPSEGVFRLVFRETILPRSAEVNVGLGVLLIALTLSVATSLIFGLLPALRLSRASHLQAMGSRGGGAGRADSRLRAALVVGQMIMATVLLVGAGLLGHSFVNLSQVEKGYNPSHALAFQLVLPTEYSTARKAETIETLLTQLRRTPGVEASGFAYAGILIGIQDTVGTWVPPGRTHEELLPDTDKPRLKTVSQGYLEAMGVRMLDGRSFDGSDTETAAPVVVVNRSIAHKFFGDRSPVGSTLSWHFPKGDPLLVTIVGVTEDIRQGAVDKPPYGEIFMDYRQVIAAQQRRGVPQAGVEHLAFGFMSFGIRTSGDPRGAIPMVRRTVYELDRNAGIDAIVPMEQLVSNSVARQRFYAVMLGLFAAVAGLLAALGIYGVLAYAVVQRTQEIGVRMALGAERRQVMALILGRGMMLAAIGITIGVAGAIGAAKYLQSMLFGVQPRDPATLAAIAIAFSVVAVIASYLPARRATKVDPMVALRVD
jgi:putative ABC transport system permease protein